MTIGQLSRRTGVNVKTLRKYEGMGLIYTVGRSAGNYRSFDESALWCVDVICTLPCLGLTVAEVREIAGIYLGQTNESIAPQVAIRARPDPASIHASMSSGSCGVISISSRLRTPPNSPHLTHEQLIARVEGSRLDSPPRGRLYRALGGCSSWQERKQAAPRPRVGAT
jgi:DNA-binding transcriptional MerR regulator